MTVCLEEGPEQVISDFTLFQERGKALCDRSVPVPDPDGTDQQIESVDTLATDGQTLSLIRPIRFELGKVVKQQILLNLGCSSAGNGLERQAHWD